MASRVIHFEIQADDIDRAKAFYENTFHWKVGQIMTVEDGGMDYWGLETGPEGSHGINGGMYRRPPENQINTYDCTVSVDSIDEAMKAVKANGGTIQGDKMEIPRIGWFATAFDTEGNKFGLMEPSMVRQQPR